MLNSSAKKEIERGLKVADLNIYQEDRIWSCYSNDKVDIGEELARVIRTLNKALPLSEKLRALSIGSSAEPQFRILETAFRAGLYLLDLDEAALDIVNERIKRQCTTHVTTIRADYNRIFLNQGQVKNFLDKKLKSNKMNLVNFHHSLYYCPQDKWGIIFDNLYRFILSIRGAMHAVLMSSHSNNPYSTTWLYNHFVGEFFGYRNTQNLLGFKKELEKMPIFKKVQILTKSHQVNFFVDDFAKFMAVVWMVLLYPATHKYSLRQREEIAEFVYKKFWLKKKPLVQIQDHLVLYRGINFRGLI